MAGDHHTTQASANRVHNSWDVLGICSWSTGTGNGSWRLQAITWTNADLSSVEFVAFLLQNGVLWDIGLMHSGIFATGLFAYCLGLCRKLWISLPNCRCAWWRHQMETLSALLTRCARNSPVTGESPLQRTLTRSFDVFFDLRLNKRLFNNRDAGDLRRHRAHYDVTIMAWIRLTRTTKACDKETTVAGYHHNDMGAVAI